MEYPVVYFFIGKFGKKVKNATYGLFLH